MSSQVEEKLDEVRELMRTAETRLLGLQYDNEQLRKKNEELEQELALAQTYIEKAKESNG